MRTRPRVDPEERDERVLFARPAERQRADAGAADLGMVQRALRFPDGPRSPDDVLRLQRVIGNQAVARLLPGPQPPHTIQRTTKRKAASAASGPSRRMRTTSPVLSGTPDTSLDQEGYCGNFKRVRNWQVSNPPTGVIVQEITRDFQIVRLDTGASLAGAALDAYVQDPNSSVHAGDTRYWELWKVARGTVGDGGDDTFGLCSIIPWNGQGALNYKLHVRGTTKGTFRMQGTAYFYATSTRPGQLGFTRGAVGAAGGLYSTTADPSGNLPAPTSGPVVYTVVVTWDGRRTYSNVTVT